MPQPICGPPKSLKLRRAPSLLLLNQVLLQGLKLYYRVLESMLKAEEARTGRSNFTLLLRNETFHKCLLACSFEMVAASYRIVRLSAQILHTMSKLQYFLDTSREGREPIIVAGVPDLSGCPRTAATEGV